MEVNMPKKLFVMVKLPPAQPDRCLDCPLLGLIPEEERKHNSKKTHVCIRLMKALARRKVKIRASDETRTKKLIRPCDKIFAAWLELPKREIGVPVANYNRYRVPLESLQQLTIDFDD